jgi:hypothetical protein
MMRYSPMGLSSEALLPKEACPQKKSPCAKRTFVAAFGAGNVDPFEVEWAVWEDAD